MYSSPSAAISFSARCRTSTKLWDGADLGARRRRRPSAASATARAGAVADRGDVGAELPQHRGREAVLLLEQRDAAGAPGATSVLRTRAASRCAAGDGLLGLDRESVACIELESLRG